MDNQFHLSIGVKSLTETLDFYCQSIERESHLPGRLCQYQPVWPPNHAEGSAGYRGRAAAFVFRHQPAFG